MQLPLEPGRSTPTTTPRLMMLDLINAALPTRGRTQSPTWGTGIPIGIGTRIRLGMGNRTAGWQLEIVRVCWGSSGDRMNHIAIC